jgi:plasmid stabilization system protein ParE
LPSLRFATRALGDLERLAEFLRESDPDAAQRTVPLVFESVEILRSHPLIGRPVSIKRRELVVLRGRTGYLVRYSFSLARDEVVILSIRHQREVDD